MRVTTTPFYVISIIILLYTFYTIIFTAKDYTIPRAQHDKPIWATWSKQWRSGYKDNKENKENNENGDNNNNNNNRDNWWDGTAVCTGNHNKDVNVDLHYRDDGSFRIAIFTDLHFSCGHKCEVDHMSQMMVDSVLDLERPDLVVFNGDTVQSEGGSEKWRIYLDAFAAVERRKIPFAVIFGNHDSDGPHSLTRERLVELANQCPHSITMSLQEFQTNHGSYIRTIKGEHNTNLLFLETNRDTMFPAQVNWLKESIEQMDNHNFLASFVFMHIPPKEFIQRMCGKDTVCNGMYGERAEYGGKDKDTGFYKEFSKLPGRVRGIVTGHDHKNDLCSIGHPLSPSSPVEVLCYARASGYGGYGEQTLNKGARIVHLNSHSLTALTYVVSHNGDRLQLVNFIFN